jgi:hypothetical protein
MKLKGNWSAETTYDVGDIVLWSGDDNFYHLQHPCKAGIPPANTAHWGMLDQEQADAARMSLDVLDAAKALVHAVEAKIPTNIDEDGIVLKSGDDEYYVSVDASGESPELTVEAIVEEGGDT